MINAAVDEAKRLVHGHGELRDDAGLRRLVGRLKAGKEWWWARRVLRLVPDSEYVRQQLALCTYKDPELRRAEALDEAWRVLFGNRQIEPDEVTSGEVAGLAGAIAKRRWDLDGRERHLRNAMRWYDRSAELHTAAAVGDQTLDPYGHINAAFVRDLLAQAQTPSTPATDLLAAGLRVAAAELRRQIVSGLEASELEEWWRRASLIEALVGLGRVNEARALLADTSAVSKVDQWERQSTAAQLLSLAAAIKTDRKELQPVLDALLGLDVPSAEPTGSVNRRFGVAMSGGGFRAALFHLGVLARLADEGLLHQVEVLSTVSGGSIVGAAYFASLAQRLAEVGEPGADRRGDLQHLISHFVETVSTKNLRMRAFLGPGTFAAGVADGRWGRTRRLGLLLEQHLLGPLRPAETRRDLRWLQVVPAGEAGNFSPKRDNWRRVTKVPILLLNATSLGTGRPWRFTGSWMGEPASLADDGLDPVTRLAPIWYDRIPGAELRVRIGEAVAASAGVPGLFAPLRIHGLYPGRTVALVDGGVYDNQGLSGLLDQDCTDLFVSDASGLMAEKTKPKRSIVRVLFRTNTVLMATVRRDTLAEAGEAAHGGRVLGLRVVHLLDGVRPENVAPIDSHDDEGGHGSADPASGDGAGPIDEALQRALAGLRTDLDRFTKAECYALMELGYRLTARSVDLKTEELACAPAGAFDWSFQLDDSWMAPESPRAERLAAAARRGRPVLGKWLPWRRRKLKELHL